MIRHQSFVALNRLPLAACLLLSVLLYGCDLFEDQPEMIPGYVRIDSIRFDTDYQTQGSNRFSFKDSWVYVDNNYLGTFENPITFPVLANGSHKISIRAGIIENGVSATRSAYMKLATWDTTIGADSASYPLFQQPCIQSAGGF
jgi:hypothetical protein